VSAAAVAGFAFTAAAVVARGIGAVSSRGRHHKWDGMTKGVRADYGALFAIPIVGKRGRERERVFFSVLSFACVEERKGKEKAHRKEKKPNFF